jgi:dihydrofolate reductase
LPEIVYYVAVSLDGYIATPDGGVEWLAPFEAGTEDYGYEEFYSGIGAVVMGSRTYEQTLTFGEWAFGPTPCWVFSTRHGLPTRPGVRITSAAPGEVVEEMAAAGIARAWLVGGGALAGSFRDAGLITRYIVSVMPVILGAGVRLLGLTVPAEGEHAASAPATRLTLVSSKAFTDGVVQLTYDSEARGEGGA